MFWPLYREEIELDCDVTNQRYLEYAGRLRHYFGNDRMRPSVLLPALGYDPVFGARPVIRAI